MLDAGDVLNDEEILVEMLSNHYVNIAVNSTGVSPHWIRCTIRSKLRSRYSWKNLETLWKSSEYINKIINSLNRERATRPDGIPIKVIKTQK